MNKRQQNIHLRRLLGREDWKFPAVWNLQLLMRAVYFAREHGLEIPSPYSDRLIVKVFSLMWEREAELSE
jgi:hypothetical protein